MALDETEVDRRIDNSQLTHPIEGIRVRFIVNGPAFAGDIVNSASILQRMSPYRDSGLVQSLLCDIGWTVHPA